MLLIFFWREIRGGSWKEEDCRGTRRDSIAARSPAAGKIWCLNRGKAWNTGNIWEDSSGRSEREILDGVGNFCENLYKTGVLGLALHIDPDGAVFCLIKYLSSRGLTWNYKSSRRGLFYGGLLALSLAGILALTLCGREWDSRPGSRFQLIPFWSYWRAYSQGDEGLGIQIVNNILLFIPFGFSLPLNFPRFERARNTVLAAALLSLTVELIQGFTGLGLCEIDDVIGNTLGGGIGVWLYLCIRRI